MFHLLVKTIVGHLIRLVVKTTMTDSIAISLHQLSFIPSFQMLITLINKYTWTNAVSCAIVFAFVQFK